MMLLSAVAPADGATTSTPTPSKVAVAQGITVAGLKAQSVFPVAPGTKETVSFALRMRNEQQLEAKVDAGIKPGHFLSVGQFAQRYGQPAYRIQELRSYLAGYGIKTTVYADQLVVTATGTAGEFDKALTVRQNEYKAAAVRAHAGIAARAAFDFHGTKDKPLLPRGIARFVQSILGLTDYPIFGSSAVHAQTAKPGKNTAGLQTGNRTPANFARDYGVTPLYGQGARGQGQTIGIVTFASVRPADATHFWSDVVHVATKPDRITLDNVDGGSGPVSAAAGSGETTLDVEQSGAIAPDANIVVYQAPNSDYGSEDAYAAVASQNRAQTVSCSWGESETVLQVTAAAGEESSTLIQADDALFLELAAQGQSSFSTSGDSAAYDASGDLGTTNLSVDNAGDSPWTTTEGATTLSGTIPLPNLLKPKAAPTDVTIPAERAWGWDWQWPYYALFPTTQGGTTPFSSEGAFAVTDVVGSGGGYSTVEHRPGYQRLIPGLGSYSAVPYLTPTDYQAQLGTTISLPTEFSAWDAATNSPVPPAVTTGYAAGRAEPDLSADGDPYTGYVEYFIGFPGNHIQDGWGGTSFVAPEMNGSAAVIDSDLGHRVGFWNPFIYRFALLSNSPFSPIDTTGGTNTNLYYTGTAGAIYNPGTGLGTPDVAKIAADFRRFS
jgi:kumamolisin